MLPDALLINCAPSYSLITFFGHLFSLENSFLMENHILWPLRSRFVVGRVSWIGYTLKIGQWLIEFV